MPIPDFELNEVFPEEELEPYRVLPSGVYNCQEVELPGRLVSGHVNEYHRQCILDGFFRLRAEAEQLGLSATQWVNGSFLSTKKSPEDIDVMSFIHGDVLNAMDDSQDEFVEKVLDGREMTQCSHDTHAFVLAVLEPDHPYYPAYERSRRHFLHYWSTTRPDQITGQRNPKGFLRMSLGAAPFPKVPTHVDSGDY